MAAVSRIHEGERIPILEAIRDQAEELRDQDQHPGGDPSTVTCPCGATGPLSRAFRCFHCEVFFCPDCAYVHFGEGS